MGKKLFQENSKGNNKKTAKKILNKTIIIRFIIIFSKTLGSIFAGAITLDLISALNPEILNKLPSLFVINNFLLMLLERLFSTVLNFIHIFI